MIEVFTSPQTLYYFWHCSKCGTRDSALSRQMPILPRICAPCRLIEVWCNCGYKGWARELPKRCPSCGRGEERGRD